MLISKKPLFLNVYQLVYFSSALFFHFLTQSQTWSVNGACWCILEMWYMYKTFKSNKVCN